MIFTQFHISGLLAIDPHRYGDQRGWFSEIFRADLFRREAGAFAFVQHNVSFSEAKHTVRGLHFQVPPRAQGKLVRCQRGRILDVAVDLRASSPTFGKYVSVELSAENGRQLWVPPGFAHGFCTLEVNSELSYLVTDYYSPEHDRGLCWNDPALGIDWPLNAGEAVISAKDREQPKLSELGAVFE